MATIEAHAPAHAHAGPKKPTGIRDWLSTVDHKKIGILYGATAIFFFLAGPNGSLRILSFHLTMGR